MRSSCTYLHIFFSNARACSPMLLANQETPCPGYYNGVLARASRDSLRAQVVSKVRTISVCQVHVISRPSCSVLTMSMVCQSAPVQPASFLRFFQYQGRLCATLIPADDARVTDRDVQHLFLKVPVSGAIQYCSRDSRYPKLPHPGRRLL